MTGPHARIIAESRDPYQTRDPGHLAYHERNRRRGHAAAAPAVGGMAAPSRMGRSLDGLSGKDSRHTVERLAQHLRIRTVYQKEKTWYGRRAAGLFTCPGGFVGHVSDRSIMLNGREAR